MRKSGYLSFSLLAIFVVIAVTPSAFADHMSATVTNAPGSSTPGCEPECFIPSMVTLDIGGEVTWENDDTAALI
jgi:plastocyanin